MPQDSIFDRFIDAGEYLLDSAFDAGVDRLENEIREEISGTNDPAANASNANQQQTPENAVTVIPTNWNRIIMIVVVGIVVVAGITFIARK